MRSNILNLFLLLGLVALPACGSGSDSGETAEGKKPRKKKKPPGKKTGGGKKKKPEKKEVPAALLEALGSEDRDERASAIRKIRGSGKVAVAPLLGLLEKKNIDARTGALLCLGLIGESSAREPVEKFLEGTESREDRIYAIETLGRLGNESTIPILKKYLTYTAPVRFAPDAGFMVEKGRETEEGMIRNQAAGSLARLGDTSGVSVLIENLLGNGWVRKDALIRLRRMTGGKSDLGYNLGRGHPARVKAVETWRAWWKKNESTFKPEWTESSDIFSLTERG